MAIALAIALAFALAFALVTALLFALSFVLVFTPAFRTERPNRPCQLDFCTGIGCFLLPLANNGAAYD
jgi:hypothetical protein